MQSNRPKRADVNLKLFFYAFVKGARPFTLPALWLPVSMAAAWAFQKTGAWDAGLFVFTLLSGTFIQTAVNFFNDGWDFKAGVDTARRKGPSRLTQSGVVSFKTTMGFGFGSCAAAVLFALPLIARGGASIAVLGAVSLVAAYMYSATRFAFSKTGLSDIAAVLFFGLFAAGGAGYIQTLQYDPDCIYLGIQCGLWALSLLIVNHLRDEEEDRKSGRKNPVTLYGREAGLLELALAQALIYLMCFYWMDENGAAGVLSFAVLPLSAILIYFIAVTPASRLYNRFLALTSLLYSLFGGLWIAGLLF